MSDPTSGGNLKPQDAVMFTLGEIKGELRALRETSTASQTAQAGVNAENKREHEEFRAKIGDHDQAIAVLKDNKQSEVSGRGELWTRIGIWVAIAGLITSTVLTIIHP